MDLGMGNNTSWIGWDAGAPCMVRVCAGCGVWVYVGREQDPNFPLCAACAKKAAQPGSNRYLLKRRG